MRKREKKEKEEAIELGIRRGRWRAEQGVLDVFLHLHGLYIL